ncbi:MAG: lysylphosphatidylglycerol synthase domain-containing protein [Desulfovibrionaceae bacterium]|nr:lysylphosphatidylglycerol synthase domain-containing protein [Desulfovibrionaceae bacterium]
MKKILHHLGHVVVFCIFAGAIYLLYHKLQAYSIEQIRDSISRISWGRIAFSMGLMVVNYMILVGYDWLALQAIHKPLPLGRTALVSFVGQAVSYNFGALLGGTTVRYRFYSSWGFSLADIVRLVLMLAVTFWVGALGLCGAVFLLAPPAIPPELAAKMPVHDVRLLGGVLLSIASAYLVACCFVRRTVHVFGKEFEFPRPRIALAQALVAGVDLIAAAACMYVLLPGSMNVSFIQFLPGYLMAQVAVVLTHIPGGVGVFELVILHLTHTTDETVVFAAVLLFRLIYFILPLLAAAVVLAVYEARQNRDALREAGRWLSVLSHSVAALSSFLAGAVLLVSCMLPIMPETRALLERWLPWEVPVAAHAACALAGMLLLLLSYGLERRQAAAYRWTVGALCAGALACLLKGLGWMEALMLLPVLCVVLFARRRFYRTSCLGAERYPWQWLLPVLGVVAGCAALAWVLYGTAWGGADRWGFEHQYNALRALYALLAAGCGLAGMLVACAIRRPRGAARRTAAANREEVR